MVKIQLDIPNKQEKYQKINRTIICQAAQT